MSRSTIDEKPVWEPDSKAVKEIKGKIIKSYTSSKGVYDSTNKLITPTPPTRFMDQYANISAFLRDTEAVTKQLKVLNELLVQELKDRKLDPKDAPVSVLREVLEKDLAKFGFQPKFAKVNEFIESGKFRETIRKGLLLKDPGANAETPHGDFTHAIQWWLIARQHQDTHFLAEEGVDSDKTVIEIFKSLGEDDTVFENTSDITGLSDKEKNIWNLIVDSPTGSNKRDADAWRAHPAKFCVPENLNMFICNTDMPELSSLRTLAQKRDQKREREFKKISEDVPAKKFSLSKNSYSLFSPLPIQIPNSLLASESSELYELRLNDDDDEDEESELEEKTKAKEFDSALFDSCEQKIHDRKYDEIIKDLSGIVRIPQSAKTLQNSHYYLGLAYYRVNNIKMAESHMRKAYCLTPIGKPKDYIPRDMIKKELATYQHILRVTQAKKDSSVEPTSKGPTPS